MKRSLNGFTLLEVLVVLAIIGVLLSILYVSFDSAKESSRDAQRKTDLTQIQLALEVYKAQNGRYPAQGCGGATTWTGLGAHSAAWGNAVSCTEWIVALAPEYIAELPQDAKFEMDDNRGFIYQTDIDGSVYKLMAHDTAEVRQIGSYNEKFARCPYDCGNAHCGLAGPQAFSYALYSPGAECL